MTQGTNDAAISFEVVEHRLANKDTIVLSWKFLRNLIIKVLQIEKKLVNFDEKKWTSLTLVFKRQQHCHSHAISSVWWWLVASSAILRGNADFRGSPLPFGFGGGAAAPFDWPP